MFLFLGLSPKESFPDLSIIEVHGFFCYQRVADPEPDAPYFGKPEPDPHRSEKRAQNGGHGRPWTLTMEAKRIKMEMWIVEGL
jgi:hypothetical protein